jgi:hypothetical protein
MLITADNETVGEVLKELAPFRPDLPFGKRVILPADLGIGLISIYRFGFIRFLQDSSLDAGLRGHPQAILAVVRTRRQVFVALQGADSRSTDYRKTSVSNSMRKTPGARLDPGVKAISCRAWRSIEAYS